MRAVPTRLAEVVWQSKGKRWREFFSACFCEFYKIKDKIVCWEREQNTKS